MPAADQPDSLARLKPESAQPEVFTLRQLEAWRHPGPALAVLGHPIAHSLSPRMHNAALAALAPGDARLAGWRYFCFDVPPDDLPAALTALHSRGFLGLNLTVPHKVLAAGLVASTDAAARPVGAVNTLLRTANGWAGFNTDGYGLSSALRECFGRELQGADVLLLGAGGAARAAAVECLQRGCASLWIANRSPERLQTLLDALRPLAGTAPLRGFSPKKIPPDLPADTLVVNATSAGLHPGEPAPVNLAALPPAAAVFDMIYNPPLTPLLHEARQLGLPHANGLAMLVHQGAKALEIWSGIPAARIAPSMAAALAGIN